MHADSVSVLEPSLPPAPAKRKRKQLLARYQPVPSGEECLTLVRAQELFRGKPWKPEEEEHCRTCEWCWHFVTHDEAECFTSRPLLEMASGRRPSKEEWEHLAKCPACAYDYDLLRQETAPDA